MASGSSGKSSSSSKEIGSPVSGLTQDEDEDEDVACSVAVLVLDSFVFERVAVSNICAAADKDLAAGMVPIC